MQDEIRVWKDEGGVLHTLDYGFEDAIRVLPAHTLKVLAQQLLSPVTAEGVDDWFAFEADLVEAAEAVLEQAASAPTDLIPVLPDRDEPNAVDEEASEAGRPVPDRLSQVLRDLQAVSSIAEQVVQVQAIRTIADEWIALTGDTEKLVGHLVLEHGQMTGATSVDQDGLVRWHFELHASGLVPGHPDREAVDE